MKTNEIIVVAKRSLALLNLDTVEGRNIALEAIDDFCLDCPVLSEKRCERCKVRSIADTLNAARPPLFGEEKVYRNESFSI